MLRLGVAAERVRDASLVLRFDVFGAGRSGVPGPSHLLRKSGPAALIKSTDLRVLMIELTSSKR